jgi:hypothetical protein
MRYLSVCMSAYLSIPSIVTRQRFNKHVPVASNTKATTEEFLGASFFEQPVFYQREVGYCFFSELLIHKV